MLRNLGIREKVLAVLAVPMVLVLALTGVIVASATSTAARASRVEQLATVTNTINTATHAVQAERAATLDVRLHPGDKALLGVQKDSRSATDAAVSKASVAIKKAPYGSVSPALGKAAKSLEAQYASIPTIRTAGDRNSTLREEDTNDFDAIVDDSLILPDLIVQALRGDDVLANALKASTAMSRTINDLSKERDLTALALERQDLTQVGFRSINSFLGQADSERAVFEGLATKHDMNMLNEVITQADLFGIDGARGETVLQLSGNISRVTPATWVKSANTMILPLASVETSSIKHAASIAGSHAGSQRNRAIFVVLLTVLSFIGVIFMGLFLSRRMVEPLLDLTDAAEAVREELPRMVARMQKPGEGPGVTIDEIPIESNDEIGRLAATFNAVNATVVMVAKEQAALRASIAEMFVNVARRNQVLLGRQLSFIDSMEKREEDPDVLENLFRLDHLATRMRRTSESLLVLAGIDASRRLRNPMPLSDVVRTAASEIEQFERIDLAANVDPLVTGRVALTLAHLLAELLENATNFSNPETRVIVSAALKPGLVELSITDYGLGMTEEEVSVANDRIAKPPLAEIAVAQRLGHFVVGRLAERLGVKVALRRGRSAGTVVFIELPTYIFQAGELPVSEAPALPAASQPTVKATAVATEHTTPAAILEGEHNAEILEDDGAVFQWPEDNFVRGEVSGPVLKKGIMGRRKLEEKLKSVKAAPKPNPVETNPAFESAAEQVAPAVVASPTAPVAQEVSVPEGAPVEAPAPVAPAAVATVVEPVAEVTPAPAPVAPVPTPTAATTLTELAVAPQPEVKAVEKPAFATSMDILPGKPLARPAAEHAVPTQRPAPATPAGRPADASSADKLDKEHAEQASARESVAAGAQIASAAFAELSTLSNSSYAPKFAPGTVPEAASSNAGLVRRQPKHEAPAPATPLTAAPAAAPRRDAESVRSTLSGFRAGVERGRTASVEPANGAGDSSSAPESSAKKN